MKKTPEESQGRRYGFLTSSGMLRQPPSGEKSEKKPKGRARIKELSGGFQRFHDGIGGGGSWGGGLFIGLGGENGINGHQVDTGSESEDAGGGVGFSGPLSGPLGGPPATKRAGNKRSARFKDEESYVEITLDVREDSVAIQNVRSEDQEAALLARALERPSPSTTAITSKLKQVSQELRRMASFSKKPAGIDRTKSGAARALKGLQFVTRNVGTGGWPEVERRFNELAVDGVLLRTRFGQCVGESPS